MMKSILRTDALNDSGKEWLGEQGTPVWLALNAAINSAGVHAIVTDEDVTRVIDWLEDNEIFENPIDRQDIENLKGLATP